MNIVPLLLAYASGAIAALSRAGRLPGSMYALSLVLAFLAGAWPAPKPLRKEP